MEYAYPVSFAVQPEGTILVTFPDIPEALTEGDDLADARVQALDCLATALEGYVEARRPIPAPSSLAAGQETVVLPPLMAAKLALYQTMLDRNVSNVALARQLGEAENAVRRLIDLRHRSHIEAVAKALAVFGKRLIVEVRDAA